MEGISIEVFSELAGHASHRYDFRLLNAGSTSQDPSGAGNEDELGDLMRLQTIAAYSRFRPLRTDLNYDKFGGVLRRRALAGLRIVSAP